MTKLRNVILASLSLFGIWAGVAMAQPASGKGPGPMAPGRSASAPVAGMGPGAGAARGAARWGSDFTPGWRLMSQQERNEHRDRMRSLKTYEECKAYQDQHHAQMAARAAERGGVPLTKPRRDACGRLAR